MPLAHNIIKDLIYFHDRINNLFEERFKSLSGAGERYDPSLWNPAVDIYETADQYIMTAELPGVTPGRVKVTVEENEIILVADRPFPAEGRRSEGYLRLEGGFGRCERRFILPGAVDREGVKANLRDGLLTVTIPKRLQRSAGVVNIEPS
jgi:HSP20 family protein